MPFDAKTYRDPALTVKYEREYIPCYGCIFLGRIFDAVFCEKGHDMTKKCKWFTDEHHKI